MYFIKKLNVGNKLSILFFLTIVGFVFTSGVGVFYVNSMKKNLDSLYFGSFVPTTELNEILNTYQGVILKSIYRGKYEKIDDSSAVLDIQNAMEKIEKNWKSYKSHYKRDEEIEYVEYCDKIMTLTDDYLKKVLYEVQNGKSLKRISIKLFEKRLRYVQESIKKLLKYEQESAVYERKVFLNFYESTKLKVLTIFITIMLALFIVSYNLFRSIQNEHERLEITTRKLKKANKRLESVSYTDVLTALYNRRYFNIVFKREIARAKRAKTFITFMMLDIDYFKQYNDIYGHMEGDKALKSVAKVLKSTLKRPSDFVFRLGGEEFGVLLSDVDESNSASLARELCETLKAQKIKHEGSLVNKYLSVSIGVVCCIADEALKNELLFNKADEMLYKAKENGRDGYIITTNVSEAAILQNSIDKEDIKSA